LWCLGGAWVRTVNSAWTVINTGTSAVTDAGGHGPAGAKNHAAMVRILQEQAGAPHGGAWRACCGPWRGLVGEGWGLPLSPCCRPGRSMAGE